MKSFFKIFLGRIKIFLFGEYCECGSCRKELFQYETLKKFKKSNIIGNEEEQKVLERYYLTGMVKFGTYFLREGGKVKMFGTAQLTPLGKTFYGSIKRNVQAKGGLLKKIF